MAKSIEYFQKLSNVDKTSQIANTYFQDVIDHFSNHLKLLEKIEKNESYQIVFWKFSLGIPVTDEERKIVISMLKNIDEGWDRFQESQQKLLQSFEQEPLQSQIQLSISDQTILMHLTNQLVSASTTVAKSKLYKQILALLKPYWIDSKLITEQQYKHFEEFSELISVLDANALEVTLYAFSHEQISRYPKVIDGIDSIVHYRNHKDELEKLLNRIKQKCTEIKCWINEE